MKSEFRAFYNSLFSLSQGLQDNIGNKIDSLPPVTGLKLDQPETYSTGRPNRLTGLLSPALHGDHKD